ncbi:hypothetical protein E0500_010280 [Streptomyces sp. KM273126]|uniref:hypothetical protein n=1 Tax=Streptomyces sp. KM273126 TaxID=2545247 RepID=UPI00103C235C|nr:hypothetical protein [Streptomyces sp. KM273126]MBA2807786.1 hypothetical protein [Streptomyces sp. KM273126]
MSSSTTRKVTVQSSAPLCPRGSRAGRLLGLLSPAVLLTGLVSCSQPAKALTTPCGVVVDGSGSGNPTKDGFDAKAKLQDALIPFLKDQECGSVDFAPITSTSQSSSCKVEQVDLDPPHGATTDQDKQREQARLLAAKQALKELDCARDDRPGSDVWGGLDRIASKMPTDGPGARLLVVSDFEQADPDFSLGRGGNIATEAKRAQTIDSLVNERGLPGIKGMEVFPVGYGMKYANKPSQQKQFEAFWTEVLEGRAKAHVNTKYQ